MASNVTPSIPGAPSFCLAIAYAARRVSILQTWTYSPQKRQDGSAFALTYSLRLRSCNSIAFIISSLPSLRWRHCKWQGPFAPRTLLRFLATPDPAATLSSSADFPVSPVIRPTLLRRFRAGTRRASPVAQHVLVTVPSLPPRRGEQPYRSVFGCSCCLRPSEVGSALGATFFERSGTEWCRVRSSSSSNLCSRRTSNRGRMDIGPSGQHTTRSSEWRKQ